MSIDPTEDLQYPDRLYNNLHQTDKESLQKEVERWSTRCNELIEQCNKVDVKEFNKLQTISNTLRVQLKKSKDDHAAGTDY